MQYSEFPVIIAGGGIGGLAAAIMLAKKGLAVTVLELAEEFGETGAGIQIGPNAFGMFEALGIRSKINEVAVLPQALVMMDALSGDEITRVPLNNDLFNSKFSQPYGVIYRPDLHNILLACAEAETNIELKTSCRVNGYRKNGKGVIVETTDGEMQAGALIGADGLWSKVRASMRGEEKPRVSGHIAYRAVLKEAEVPAANRKKEVILWAGPKTHLVHYPLHMGEIFNLVAVFHSDRYEEGWDVFGDKEELDQRFAGQNENVLNMLEKIDSWRMWVLCDREPIKNWSDGCVTLLGDAAHPTMQYLAQGACMAMEDGVCLANCLEQNDGDFKTAFIEYQQARYLRTARVQLTSRFYGDVYHAENVTAELRKRMFSGRDAQAAYAGMEWLYNGVDARGRQVL
jgi:salicylate hydroxylase